MSALRNRQIYFHGWGNILFTLAWPAASLLCLRWSVTAPERFAKWRELPAALFPLAGCLAPCTWQVRPRRPPALP